MSSATINQKIDKLFEREEWGAARKLLIVESEKTPESHWLLTQLGVTYYEQRKYKEALELFEASRRIVPDCPLTLWNLAGTLSALGKQADAIRIYSWLLNSKASSKKDTCWESQIWADSLKADCVFRLGDCFRYLGKLKKAEHCYRQYLDLILIGIKGMYSGEEVLKEIQSLHPANGRKQSANSLNKVVEQTLRGAGISTANGHGKSLPIPKVGGRSGKQRVASKG